MINRRGFIKSLGMAAIGFSTLDYIGRCVAAHTDPPYRNFLFIIADDLGRRDLGVDGSTFHETPRVNSIAEKGVRFTNGYATCQVCSPSRASIMTGKYTPRHGITDWIGAKSGTRWNRGDKLLPAEYEHALSKRDTTIAEALKEAGYTTFFAGKWHLGPKPEDWPEHHGFDYNVGGWSSGSPKGGYFSPYTNPRLENGPDAEYLPLRLARETATFIEQHRDRKFFAYLSFYAVHAPIQTTKKLWSKYQRKASTQPKVKERFMIDRTLPVRQVQDNPIYAGLLETVDQAVGIVLDKLKELGLDKNTVVIFTSDNGGVSSGDNYSTCNLPFRGGKGRQWEGGIREPYLVRVPGVTKAGATCDVPVISTDFYPTILELAGLPLKPRQHLDGLSLVPLLKGGTIKKRDLFWHYPHYGNQGGEPSSIIRSGDWKLIHYWEDGRDELYHLATDIGEQNDLSSSEPEIRKRLRRALDKWLNDVGARIPQADPRYKPENAQKKKEKNLAKKRQLERQHSEILHPDWKPDQTWWGSIPKD